MIIINREILNELCLKVEKLEKRKVEVLAEFQRLRELGTSFCMKRDDQNKGREERLLYAEQAEANYNCLQKIMSENGKIKSDLFELNREISNGSDFLNKYERSPHILLLNLKKDILELNDNINSYGGKLVLSEFDRIGMMYLRENLNDIMSDVPLRQYNYSIEKMQVKYVNLCKTLLNAISYIGEGDANNKSPNSCNVSSVLEGFANQLYLPIMNVKREHNNLPVLLENLPGGKIPFRSLKEFEAYEKVLFQNKLLELGFHPTKEKTIGFLSMFTLFGRNKGVFNYDRLVRIVESMKNSGKINGSIGVDLLDTLEKFKADPTSNASANSISYVAYNTSLPQVIQYEFYCILKIFCKNRVGNRNAEMSFLSSSSGTEVDEKTNLLTH